jgi:hypothetical protein
MTSSGSTASWTTRVHLDRAGRKLLVRVREPTGGVTVGFDPADAHVVGVDGR